MIKTFRRVPSEVQAMQLTPDNIGYVAYWCEATIQEPAFLALPDGSIALLGSWVVWNGEEFETFTEDAFSLAFEEA